jgi:hypothetical protein
MAMSRKDALKRLNGLAPQVEKHLDSIGQYPSHTSVAHWRNEASSWLKKTEDALPHVGKKTAAEWQARLEGYKAQLEIPTGNA